MNLVQIKKNSERKQVINTMYFKQFSNKILTTSTFKLSLKFLLNYILLEIAQNYPRHIVRG